MLKTNVKPYSRLCGLAIFIHEALVELGDELRVFINLGSALARKRYEATPKEKEGDDNQDVRQEGGSEVQSALLLSKARAGNEANARLTQELHAVESISSHAQLSSLLFGLFWEVELREQVHGACVSSAVCFSDRGRRTGSKAEHTL